MNNTTSATLTDGDLDEPAVIDFTEHTVSLVIWKYVPPFLIVLGTIGNILTVVVLSRTSMRHSTTSLYLRALAVVDIVVLNTGLIRQWLRYIIDVDIRWKTEVGCKIHTWAVYFSVHSSAWLLVAVTVERVLSVMFPHTVKLRCTRKAAYAIISSILLFFLLINAHYFYGIGDYVYTRGNETYVIPCDGITNAYYKFETRIWPWVDASLYSFVPSTILVISNFYIIKKVFASDKMAVDNRGYNGEAGARKSKTAAMTMTLVAISANYVICTTPFCIYVIYTNIYSKVTTNQEQALRDLLWSLVNILMYTNNAINFLLYCVTGTRFRQELRGLLCRKKLVSRPTMYTSTTRATKSSSTPEMPRNTNINSLSTSEETRNTNVNSTSSLETQETPGYITPGVDEEA